MCHQETETAVGTIAGETSSVEPSATATLALRLGNDAGDSYERGLQWLCAAQQQDGGLTAGDRQSGWQMAWTLLALTRSGVADEPLLRVMDWLSNVALLILTDDGM